MEKKKELKYNSPHKPSLDERHSDTKVKLRKPISYDAHDMHMKTSQSSESLNSLNGGVRHRPGRQKSHLVASDSLRNLIDGDSPKRRSHADSAGTATESKGPTTLAVPHSLSLT
ncbi:hypothetical protein SARC_08968 [Sphaeroforma arctica JP610]|uniref:Uncharacterized protein n=1 Tax=Sphaeroforma arctica JP610 TaxID=667725 RepID=A0A0L0FPH7_9EUKA|nr:hypothetical protein SARC_08968 [Sphaeroforma arctica JP610]KNC78609.1 hypothetical protein SARC_08968 [Sphaeroforma arctica JP610]|eukprot:XP_014152511.1 hypothetical protein SARC_08968 [Sphaeroforma arctica JP610]